LTFVGLVPATTPAAARPETASAVPGVNSVVAFGDAGTLVAGTPGPVSSSPLVGIAASADRKGFWLVTSTGLVIPYGDAHSYGSIGDVHLNEPVVGMAATPDGRGYWLVAADGGVFSFGDATFHGSTAGATGVSPDGAAVGIAASPSGYWVAFGERTSPVPAIAAYAATRGDNITVAVEDLTDGHTYYYRPGVVENTASTLKVDILATLEVRAQSEGRGLSPAEQSLAVPMIEDSLDSAADILWGELGPGSVASLEHAVGMTSTVPATNGIWGETTTTAADRLAMVRAVVFPNPVLRDASRSYILYLMEHITPSQDWGATGGVPAGVTVALKNGFAVINGWQINTEAWVHGDGRDYLISVLTDGNPTEAYGIQTVDSISSIVWNALR
jgi:hypothetical protein